MKVTCRKSGISYTMPQLGNLLVVNAQHPVFDASQRSLLVMVGSWQRGDLDDASSVLLFLALADSTDLVLWDSPFQLTPVAMSQINANMARMASCVFRLNEIRSVTFEVPKFMCSKHGAVNTVEGFLGAVASWEDAIADMNSATARQMAGAKLNRIEQGLERLLRLQKRKPEAYAKRLAAWASEASAFPTDEIVRNGKVVTTKEYWEALIYRIFMGSRIEMIPEIDIIDLLEFCEVEIPHGNIFAESLMSTLRNALQRQQEFLGVPILRRVKTFTVIGISQGDEDQRQKDSDTLKQMALQAPLIAPTRMQFESVFAFLRAQVRWEAQLEMKRIAEAEKKVEGVPDEIPKDPT